MTTTLDPHLGEVHVSAEWAARIENLSRHHVRRRARAGLYPGARRRDGDGRWLIPISSITRTLDGLLQHVQDRDGARLR